MALLTDGKISEIENLQDYDGAILAVAKTEGVDLGRKAEIAEQEISLEIQAFLLRHANRQAASRLESGEDLSRVVATPGLRQWHALRTLALVYGDIYNSQLNDRYLGKWHYFLEQAKRISDLLFETGVGMVWSPVPRAMPPRVTGDGSSLEPRAYVIRVCWATSAGVRGAASEPVVFLADAGELPIVEAVDPPATAAGYDVFVGFNEEETLRQNQEPVGIGETWRLSGLPLVAGDPPSEGQRPDYYLRRTRTL